MTRTVTTGIREGRLKAHRVVLRLHKYRPSGSGILLLHTLPLRFHAWATHSRKSLVAFHPEFFSSLQRKASKRWVRNFRSVVQGGTVKTLDSAQGYYKARKTKQCSSGQERQPTTNRQHTKNFQRFLFKTPREPIKTPDGPRATNQKLRSDARKRIPTHMPVCTPG